MYPWKVHNHSYVFKDEILKQQYGPPTEKKGKKVKQWRPLNTIIGTV